MQKISVTGADGGQRVLALVRAEGRVSFACPMDRYLDVMAGNEDSVVGFPAEDVEIISEAGTRQ